MVKKAELVEELNKTKQTLKVALELSRRAVHLLTQKKKIDMHKLWLCYEKYKDTQEWEKMVESYRQRTGDTDIGIRDTYILIDWIVNTKDRWANI